MEYVSQVNFLGSFHYQKLKPKQNNKLNEILNTKINGTSNTELLNKMPFDIDVVCLNPSKKAINPRFRFWVTHTKKKATLEGNIKLTSKEPVQDNALKLNNFINNFNNKLKSLKGDEKLTSAEETRRQVDFILFGKY